MNLNGQTQAVMMLIDNVPVICSNEFEIVEQLTNTSTIILKNCYPELWETTHDYTNRFYMPKDYSKFELFINLELVFVGVVKRQQAMDLNPSKFHGATLQVLDYKTFLSEGEQLNFVIVNSTIQSCIEQVLEKYADYNFALGNLNVSSDKLTQVVNNYNCNEKTAYDCLTYFANLVQAVWKTRYDAEEDKTYIDFYEIDKLPKGTPIYYQKQWAEENSVIDLKYSFSTNDYRNKQIITADQVGSNIQDTDTFFCNGSQKVFKLEYPIYKIVSAKLNGVNLKVMSQHIVGQRANAYYEIGTDTLELVSTPDAGNQLDIVYIPMIAGRQVVKNEIEINRIGTQQGNSGVIARYENRRDASTSQELGAIAQSYINFKGKEQITLTLRTINNDLYNVGDRVLFNNNGITELENLQNEYCVKKKTIKYIQSNADTKAQIIITYELVNNFNFEDEINYFDNQRAKMIGNIKEGEYINRYIDYTKNINIIFDEAEITPTDLEGNVLDAVLDFSFTK